MPESEKLFFKRCILGLGRLLPETKGKDWGRWGVGEVDR